MNTRLYLEQFQNPLYSVQDRLSATLMSITGYAREILEYEPNIRNTNEVFRVLRETYGKEVTHTSLVNVKQTPEESVKVYFARLKLNFKKAGFDNGLEAERALLSYFIHGLRADIGKKLQAIWPSRITAALDSALQIELDFLQNRNKKTPDLNQITTEESQGVTTKNITQHLTNSQFKKLSDNFGDLNEKLNNLIQSNKYKTQNNYDPSKKYKNVECFHCKQKGHGFYSCPTITPTEKEKIIENLPNLIAKLKENKNNHLNSSAASKRPRTTQ